MDREAWRAAVHGVAKSRIQVNNWTELKASRAPAVLRNWHLFCRVFENFETGWKPSAHLCQPENSQSILPRCLEQEGFYSSCGSGNKTPCCPWDSWLCRSSRSGERKGRSKTRIRTADNDVRVGVFHTGGYSWCCVSVLWLLWEVERVHVNLRIDDMWPMDFLFLFLFLI